MLVLDRNYRPIRIVDVRGAIYLIFREAANVLDNDYNVYNLREWIDASNRRGGIDNDFKYLRSVSNNFGVPDIVILKNFIQKKIRTGTCSKKNIFLRDMYQCQYCKLQMSPGYCTIDHVIPVSSGGGLTWSNAVTSCRDCNNKKGNKRLDEWGVSMIKQPIPLKWDHKFFRSYVKRHPNKAWERFLGIKNEKI